MKIYISGPMTGLPDYNFPAFHAAASKLRESGHAVVNPAEMGIMDGATWEDYLRRDIAELITCDGIFLLPGWSVSRGAMLEYHIAKQLGMTQVRDGEVQP